MFQIKALCSPRLDASACRSFLLEAEAREARSPQAQIECRRTCELMSPGLVPIRAANCLVYLFGEMGCGGDRGVGV